MKLVTDVLPVRKSQDERLFGRMSQEGMARCKDALQVRLVRVLPGALLAEVLSKLKPGACIRSIHQVACIGL